MVLLTTESSMAVHSQAGGTWARRWGARHSMPQRRGARIHTTCAVLMLELSELAEPGQMPCLSQSTRENVCRILRRPFEENSCAISFAQFSGAAGTSTTEGCSTALCNARHPLKHENVGAPHYSAHDTRRHAGTRGKRVTARLRQALP